MNAISRPLAEPPADRRDRQLDYFRRAADKAMRAVDIASEQLEAAHATGEPGATASPTLDLARATLVLAVNAENRVVAGETAPRAPANDPRRPLLREALHQAASAEPNPKLRAALHRDIDDRIEETLLEDPDGDIDLIEHLCALGNEFDLPCNPAKLSDAVLGVHANERREPNPHRDPEPGHPDTRDPDTGDPRHL